MFLFLFMAESVYPESMLERVGDILLRMQKGSWALQAGSCELYGDE